MTNQDQQSNQQPQIQKETEHAFAPSPKIGQQEQDAEKKPETTEANPAPEKDIDNVN